MIRIVKISSILTLAVFLLVIPSAQAQETTDEENGMGKAKEEVEQFFNAFLDWAVLSYATYSGQNEGEIGSIFAKAKDALENQPELQVLLSEVQNAVESGRLEQAMHEFTNQTGARIYVLPEKKNEGEGFYVKMFNKFLAEGAANPVEPYILIKTTLSGTKADGYNLTFEVKGSSKIKMSKYNLDVITNENPFFPIAGATEKRQEVATQLKLGLTEGVEKLRQDFTQNLLPPLYIMYDGNVYRPGDEIEQGMEDGETVTLVALDKDGDTPGKTVEWTVSPDDLETEITANEIVVPLNTAGEWSISAKAGNDNAAITFKVINFSLDWREILKDILKEVVNESIAAAREKIEKAQADMESEDQLLADYREILTDDGFDVISEPDESFYDSYEEPFERVMSAEETAAYFSSTKKKEFANKLGKFAVAAAALVLELNVEVFLNALIDDDDKLNEFVQSIKDNSPDLITELVTQLVTAPEKRSNIKEIVVSYLNERINEIANSN